MDSTARKQIAATASHAGRHPRLPKRVAEYRHARDLLCGPMIDAVVQHLLAQGATRGLVAAALTEMKEKR